MPRPTISNLQALGDFTQSFRWSLSLVSAPSTAIANFPTTTSIVEMDFRIETAGLPHATGTTVDITIHGTTVRQPGIYKKYGTLVFTFAETVDNTITAWFAAWQSALWLDDAGTRAAKAELTADFMLTRLDNADNPIWVYNLKECFLEDTDPGALTPNSADPLRPSLTLSYDDFTQAAAPSATGGGPF